MGCADWAELCSLHTSLCGSCVLEIRESISLALGALDHGSREAVEEGQRPGVHPRQHVFYQPPLGSTGGSSLVDTF